ncbi:hypothetical protein WJX84_006639 [Apatococcus fuscideae]|uniref:Uncharacterized protein n=1 Tax=Apatococcus fuscideae TaxID=2026836 RepID=A0AAW1SW19_9CHLO
MIVKIVSEATVTAPLLGSAGQQQATPTNCTKPVPFDEEAALDEPQPPQASQILVMVQPQGMPEAGKQLRAQLAVMVVWCVAAILTVLFPFPMLGFGAALIGIIGSPSYFGHYCGVQHAKSTATNIKVVSILALTASCLSGLSALIMFNLSIATKTDETVAADFNFAGGLFLGLTLWHLMHSLLLVFVAQTASSTRRLMNPFTSGIAC